MNAIIDSATDLVAVQGLECNNCTGQQYDLLDNVLKGRASIEDENTTVSYGDYDFHGAWAKDRFCLSIQYCVDDFEFFYIMDTEHSLSVNHDALLGMARHS